MVEILVGIFRYSNHFSKYPVWKLLSVINVTADLYRNGYAHVQYQRFHVRRKSVGLRSFFPRLSEICTRDTTKVLGRNRIWCESHSIREQHHIQVYVASDIAIKPKFMMSFFSNGNLDPWSGGGVTSEIEGADTLHVLYITDSAHHYDLRGGNPDDTQYILDARTSEINIIKGWLGQISSGSMKSTVGFFAMTVVLYLSLFVL